MAYYSNFTNDPQQDWYDNEEDFSDNCPECGSDRIDESHYNVSEGTTTYRCLDCDEFFDI